MASPKQLSITAAAAALRRQADAHSELETECLFGESFQCDERANGWVRGTLQTDGYCGWVAESDLGVLPSSSHRVVAVRSVIRKSADLKSETLEILSMGSLVTVIEQDQRNAQIVLSDEIDKPGESRVGFMSLHHLSPIAQTSQDASSIAKRLLETPYRWGGRHSAGIDCSALIQIAFQECGINLPRDTGDQVHFLRQSEQAMALSVDDSGRSPLLPKEALMRGDLVYWKGHVGIMLDDRELLHANAWHGCVATEPLIEAAIRIETESGSPVGFFRIADTLATP